jgi:phosphonate transport system substrate-binding protein
MPRPAAGYHLAGMLLTVVSAASCDRSPYRSLKVEARPVAPEAAASSSQTSPPVLRISVASIESPRDTFNTYRRLFDRVGEILGVEVEFVQRRTYREVNDLLIAGQIDAALLCTGGYLDVQRRAPGAVEAVAVPVIGGDESYRSVVIVPAGSKVQDLTELKGRKFAFTDELSFSGHLYVLRALRDRGLDPSAFFESSIYTGSHDRSVQAVAAGLVDGATVHGAVLEHMMAKDPSVGRHVRIVHRSPPLGGMPVVVSKRLPAATRGRIGATLIGLDSDPVGKAVLQVLRFDRFAAPSPGLYASAARMVEER